MSAVVASAAGGLLSPTAAVADQGYQTQKYPLSAVAGGPLARGHVINIHANGPVVYGQERYDLAGAAPSTDYQVVLTIFGDPDCTLPAGLVFPTAVLRTNRVGNGHAKATFSAEAVAELVTEPTTLSGIWTFSTDGEVAYTTGCQTITLDVPPARPPAASRP